MQEVVVYRPGEKAVYDLIGTAAYYMCEYWFITVPVIIGFFIWCKWQSKR